MPLIQCDECTNQISDRAASCPHCGCPVSTVERSVSQDSSTAFRSPSPEFRKRLRRKTGKVIIGVIYGIAFLVLVIAPSWHAVSELARLRERDRPVDSGTELERTLTTGSWMITKAEDSRPGWNWDFSNTFEHNSCWTFFRDHTVATDTGLKVKTAYGWEHIKWPTAKPADEIEVPVGVLRYDCAIWWMDPAFYRWEVRGDKLVMSRDASDATTSPTIIQPTPERFVLEFEKARYEFKKITRVDTDYLHGNEISNITCGLFLVLACLFGLFASTRWHPTSRWKTFGLGWLCTAIFAVGFSATYAIFDLDRGVIGTPNSVAISIVAGVLGGLLNGFLRSFVLVTFDQFPSAEN